VLLASGIFERNVPIVRLCDTFPSSQLKKLFLVLLRSRSTTGKFLKFINQVRSQQSIIIQLVSSSRVTVSSAKSDFRLVARKWVISLLDSAGNSGG